MNFFNQRNRHGSVLEIGADRGVFRAVAAFILTMVAMTSSAGEATLDQIAFAALPGDRVQVQLFMSAPVEEPLSFAIDNPARIALDFPGVTLNLPRKTESIGVGMARSVTAVEAAGRTRVVLSLIKLVPYELKVAGNQVTITLDSAGAAGSAAFTGGETAKAASVRGSIENVDFRRGEDGEGRVHRHPIRPINGDRHVRGGRQDHH